MVYDVVFSCGQTMRSRWSNDTPAPAKYYNSNIGRFISLDPWSGDISDPQSLNKYTYVRNNPLKYIDPNGEETEIWIKHPINNEGKHFYNKDYGHTMIKIDDEVYDFISGNGDVINGPGKLQKQDISEKMKYYHQDDGAVFTVFKLKLDTEGKQEDRIAEHLEYWIQNQDELPNYRVLSNNCTDYIVEELLNEFANFDIKSSIDTPVELSNELFDSDKVSEISGGYELDNKFRKVSLSNDQKKSHGAVMKRIRGARNTVYSIYKRIKKGQSDRKRPENE
jgi:RHS repeat-associated protein